MTRTFGIITAGVLLLGGCGEEHGTATGTFNLQGEEIAFDGGALAFDQRNLDGTLSRVVTVSDRTAGFHCRWAVEDFTAVHGGGEGRAPGVLVSWLDTWPDLLLFSALDRKRQDDTALAGFAEFDDEARTRGRLVRDTGAVVEFDAVDCGLVEL